MKYPGTPNPANGKTPGVPASECGMTFYVVEAPDWRFYTTIKTPGTVIPEFRLLKYPGTPTPDNEKTPGVPASECGMTFYVVGAPDWCFYTTIKTSGTVIPEFRLLKYPGTPTPANGKTPGVPASERGMTFYVVEAPDWRFYTTIKTPGTVIPEFRLFKYPGTPTPDNEKTPGVPASECGMTFYVVEAPD